MLAVAALSALIAIAVGGTLAEGIVLSAILGLVLWVALSLPFPVWVRQLVLSGGDRIDIGADRRWCLL